MRYVTLNLSDATTVYTQSQVTSMSNMHSVTINNLYSSVPTAYGLAKMQTVLSNLQLDPATNPPEWIATLQARIDDYARRLAEASAPAPTPQIEQASFRALPAVKTMYAEMQALFGKPYTQEVAARISQILNTFNNYIGGYYDDNADARISTQWILQMLSALRNYVQMGSALLKQTITVQTPEALAQTPEPGPVPEPTVTILPVVEPQNLMIQPGAAPSAIAKLESYFKGTYSIAGHAVSKALVLGGVAAAIALYMMTGDKK